ncbi:MAG: SCO family protein, partial [Saprospiraceae bacterium]
LGLQKEDDEFLHTENFVLIDKNRHIRGIYNGLNKISVRQLIADIHTLKNE